MPFPVTCTSVGDVLALVQLGIDIVKFVNDCHGAPTECRTLWSDFTSLERLLEATIPSVEAMRNIHIRDIVIERIMAVYELVLSGLQLIAHVDLVDVASPVPKSFQRSFLQWASRVRRCVQWKLHHSADAKKCQAKIGQALQHLMFAMLLSKGLCDDLTMVMDLISETTRFQQQCIAAVHGSIIESHAALDDITYAIDDAKRNIQRLSAQLDDMKHKTTRAWGAVSGQLCSLQTTVDSNQQSLRYIRCDTTTTRAALETFVVTVNEDRIVNHINMASIERELRSLKQLVSASNAATGRPIGPSAALVKLPGAQQLRLARDAAWRGSLTVIANAPRELLSREAITTAVFLALSSQNAADRTCYTCMALAFLVLRCLSSMCKTPAVVHIVFLVDLFDVTVEVPLASASSSVELQQYLLAHFSGRLGEDLVRGRRYELLHCASSSSAVYYDGKRLPVRWNHKIKPGEKIFMNAVVEQAALTTCPACATKMPSFCANADGWVQCARCLASFQTNQSDAALQVELQTSQSDVTGVVDDEPPFQTAGMINHETKDLQADSVALRFCRRIRVQLSLTQDLDSEHEVLTKSDIQIGVRTVSHLAEEHKVHAFVASNTSSLIISPEDQDSDEDEDEDYENDEGHRKQVKTRGPAINLRRSDWHCALTAWSARRTSLDVKGSGAWIRLQWPQVL
ncbi:hypothetical protein BKA62DRAFT_769771 [Auriculariales sp. MPI-PUGE-AT-0066]|nr:hypothetical protein BKA62DRAFT_769771 [Auriculariales sp. MPI-PUGE-AT-0066]